MLDALNRLSSFKNLRRKGGKFDHRPWRPKVVLRHWCCCIVFVAYSASAFIIIDVMTGEAISA